MMTFLSRGCIMQWLAVLALSGISCGDSGSTLILSVSGLTDDIRILRLAGMLGTSQTLHEYNAASLIGLNLPQGARGEITLSVSGLTDSRCLVASGQGRAVASGQRRLDVNVQLTQCSSGSGCCSQTCKQSNPAQDCGECGPTCAPGPVVDMGGMPSDLALPASDMAGQPNDMSQVIVGNIGQPCTIDIECTVGPSPKCWKNYVLNNVANPPTLGGYCSSTCTTDAQCGIGNRCVDLGPGGFCLASCSNATTCRHPGYACSYYDTEGICFPNSRLDCDPRAATGACRERDTGKAGGCLRQAYENQGICAASCTVGPGTCTAISGYSRQCIYLDATKTTAMDIWKGAICFQSPATPHNAGDPCTLLNN